MNYHIATEDDIPELSEMRWQHEFEEEEINCARKEEFLAECNSFFSEGLKNGSWVCWIAEENNTLVSNICIHRIRKVPKPQKLFSEIGYVTNVHTRAEYRNKGIGTELLKQAKLWASANRIELLFVWPSTRAVSFYERQGFSGDNEIMELEF